MRLVKVVGIFAAWWLAGICAAADIAVSVSVVDQVNHPVSGVRVQLKRGEAAAVSADTDEDGYVEFKGLQPGRYEITAHKEGFEPLAKGDLDFSQAGADVELTLVPVMTRRDSVEVTGEAAPVEEGASTSNAIIGQDAKTLPSRPATVTDALPLIPGVARSPGGGLQISGVGEHRSSLIVNSADVTDPATGQFGLTVPMDSVESLNVFQTPFLAEYGRFTAGLVSVATRRGGDKWKWELNDPFPEFFIRSWRLRGLRDATPRLNFEGPLIPGKLYFAEGLEYEVRKTPVFTLPFPNNLKSKQGINSFAQFDWVASEKNLVTLTVHAAPQRLGHVNMDYYNPQQTTPDASTHNYTATLGDRLTLGGGLLDTTLSFTKFEAEVWSLGQEDLTMAPQGNTGDYFAAQNRTASRLGVALRLLLRAGEAVRAAQFQVGRLRRQEHRPRPGLRTPGGYCGRQRAPVAADHVYQRPALREFRYRGRLFRPGPLDDHAAAGDGSRDAHRIAGGFGGVSPGAARRNLLEPVFQIGDGGKRGVRPVLRPGPAERLLISPVPQSNRHHVQPGRQRGDRAYPVHERPGRGDHAAPFRVLEPTPGNFSPRSATWNVQVEQPLTRNVKLRAGYMSNLSDGLVVLDRSVPDPATGSAANVLSGTGQSRYRQLELTTRVGLGHARQLFLSYVNSRARGDLNEFSGFIGSFPVPIIHPNQFGNLPTDLPHRFLAWGSVPLPAGFGVAPVVEYRSGFPYASLDAVPALLRGSQSEPFSPLPLRRCARVEGYPAESEILGASLGERL